MLSGLRRCETNSNLGVYKYIDSNQMSEQKMKDLLAKNKSLRKEIARFRREITDIELEKKVIKKLSNFSQGKYGIQKFLGLGSFGQVFKAIDFTLCREKSGPLNAKLKQTKDAYDAVNVRLERLNAEVIAKREARTFNSKDARARAIISMRPIINAEITRLGAEIARLEGVKRELGVVAVKSINLRNKNQTAAEVDREVDVMLKLHHDNIVRVFTYLKPVKWRFIVMEFCDVGNVDDLILKNGGELTVSMVKDFSRSILSALRYLHEQNIVHNDVKPENIMVHRTVNGQYMYKLADFGGAEPADRPYSSMLKSVSGTWAYMAPEKVLINKQTERLDYNAKADIYALGVSIYILLTGRHTMASPPKTSPPNHIRKIMNHPLITNPSSKIAFYTQDARCDATAKNFIWQLTTFDAHKRPTAETLEHHLWLQQTDVVDDVPEYIQQRLIKYAGLSQMQKIVRRNIKGMLPTTDIAAMRTLFEQVTHQRLFILQDKISVKDMQTFMDNFGIEADIEAVDINSDGKIDVDEFITAVLAPWLWKTDYRADDIFSKLDTTKNGEIDADELATLTGKSVETATLFSKIDIDNSGGISKGEFRTWIHHKEEPDDAVI